MDWGDLMEHSEFEIGMTFYSGATTLWRCTDVGSRTIVAVEVKNEYPARHQAPPFSDAVEIVFDEYDFGGLSRQPITG
ncbi:hypothetical protein OKW41_006133 [Paraburkholderia sp. UCT70]|uniref:hypothetical protein n=1 Tax=Paraburkholderia sp. UCT70 TaxID=2991068 RepID=UPI003D1F97D9